MTQIGVGLIGCGGMGQSLATQCKDLPQARLLAVSDIDEAAATSAGEKLGVADRYTDNHTLLARDDIQAVLIGVPPYAHCEVTLDAAAAGKHVFCEKPMSTNIADCSRMIRTCRQRKVKLMIGQVCRYHAIHAKVRELVAGGTLGKPICMRVHRIGPGWSANSPGLAWRLCKARSGGVLMEVNAHEIDFMRFVCGDVASVHAIGGNYRQKAADYPDIALVSMAFKSGAVGLLHSSMASAIGSYGGRVDCEEGTIDFPAIWGEGAGIRYGKFGETPTFIPVADLQVEVPVRHEVRVFIEAVINDTPVEIPGEEGRATVEIAQAAYRSIATGRPVRLPLKA